MDLRRCINLISDIVNNRPAPIRELDQIYMKHADMLLQIEHINKYFAEKKVLFVGDGDAIALGLAYLQKSGEIAEKTKEITVLDFDERIVNSINRFASEHDLSEIISAQLYNVADPLPEALWGQYDCFYCNPPFGAHNEGKSIIAFMRRGFEATGDGAVGCVVMADVPETEWTGVALSNTQKFALKHGFVVCEMIPRFHTYHLKEAPELTSCSILFRRIANKSEDCASQPLDAESMQNFYGADKPLIYKYVKDTTENGQVQLGYELVKIDGGDMNV